MRSRLHPSSSCLRAKDTSMYQGNRCKLVVQSAGSTLPHPRRRYTSSAWTTVLPKEEPVLRQAVAGICIHDKRDVGRHDMKTACKYACEPRYRSCTHLTLRTQCKSQSKAKVDVPDLFVLSIGMRSGLTSRRATCGAGLAVVVSGWLSALFVASSNSLRGSLLYWSASNVILCDIHHVNVI
jgi:hypothetical protein